MTSDLSVPRALEAPRVHSLPNAPSDARNDLPGLVFNNSICSPHRFFPLAEQRLKLCGKTAAMSLELLPRSFSPRYNPPVFRQVSGETRRNCLPPRKAKNGSETRHVISVFLASVK
jgi:hypothetical protein